MHNYVLKLYIDGGASVITQISSRSSSIRAKSNRATSTVNDGNSDVRFKIQISD